MVGWEENFELGIVLAKTLEISMDSMSESLLGLNKKEMIHRRQDYHEEENDRASSLCFNILEIAFHLWGGVNTRFLVSNV